MERELDLAKQTGRQKQASDLWQPPTGNMSRLCETAWKRAALMLSQPSLDQYWTKAEEHPKEHERSFSISMSTQSCSFHSFSLSVTQRSGNSVTKTPSTEQSASSTDTTTPEPERPALRHTGICVLETLALPSCQVFGGFKKWSLGL